MKLTLLLFMLSASAFADCPQFSEGQLSKASVISLIKNPDCKIQSIEDFLGHLPTSYFSGYALMYQSQSLQDPHAIDYMNPRAIIYGTVPQTYSDDTFVIPSPPSLIMTFNGSLTQAGYNSLEMVEINSSAKDANGVFGYFAVDFPQSQSGQIQISDTNPARCIRCHDSPAHAILNNYPLWTGSYGSMKFPTLEVTNFESQKYLQFMASAATHPRYKFLQPPADETRPTDPNAPDPVYSYLEASVSLLDTVLKIGNEERSARIMMSSANYDKTKYAIAAGLLQCPSWEEALPNDVKAGLESNLNTLFSLDAITSDKETQFFKAEYRLDDTREFPDHYMAPSFDQALQTVQSNAGPYPYYLRMEVDTLTKQGPEQDSTLPIPLRFLMEGRGMRIGSWFMPLDQQTYRVGDGLIDVLDWLRILINLDPSLQSYQDRVNTVRNYTKDSSAPTKAALCAELKQKSLTALAGLQIPPLASPGVFQGGFPEIFSQVCAKCHVQKMDPRAPTIPFDEQTSLSAWFTQKSHRDLVRRRIDGQGGRPMPPDRWLTPAQRAEILNYISSLGN